MATYTTYLSNDSRYYTTLTITESDSGQVRTLSYTFTATKTSGSGYYSNTGNNQVTITIDGYNIVNKKISYDFTGSTPKTITLASGSISSNDYTFSGLEIPIYTFFDMSGTGRGVAATNDTFTLNTLHEPPYNVTYTITETNQDLISAGISDNVFVQNLSIKQFYFTASFHDSDTYNYSRVYNYAMPINWETSEEGTPRTVIYNCKTSTLLPYNVVEPPITNKVAILGAVFDSTGLGGYGNDATTSNPDLYDYIPYIKPNINNSSLYFKRYGQTTGRAVVSLAGYFYNNVVGNKDQSNTYKPTISYKFWKKEDTEPVNYSYTIPSGSITIDANEGSFSIYKYDIGSLTETDVNYLDPDYSWNVKFKVNDYFEEYESDIVSIKKGAYTWAELKDRVDFARLTINNKQVFPNLYSSNEVIIGIDDNNNFIYRKEIDMETLTPNGVKSVLHGITNLGDIKNVSCIGKTTDWQFPIPFVGNPNMFNSANFGIRISPTNVVVYCPSGITATAKAIIEYTKSS